MNSRRAFCIILLVLVGHFLSSCGKKTKNKPVLLDDRPQSIASDNVAGTEADNNRCFVCHINFSFDDFATSHAQANIGCETCHGASDAHCSDEDNITPPDIMYPKATLNLACLECHNRSDIEIEPHEAILSENLSDGKYCTTCHGEHHLAHRTRVWNKETGELIKDDKVRMIEER
jgi:hypothetical protein